jgi:transposase
MILTEAQRDTLLNRAVDAVRERYAVTPDTDPGEVSRRSEVATMAVTDAVTRGGHIHTLISQRAGVSGLMVIRLISDWSAQGRALGVERQAAKNYTDLVREAAASHARRRVGAEGYGAKSAIAREVGVTRPVVDDWIARVD